MDHGFADLLQDEDELYFQYVQGLQARMSLDCALVVLKKYPEGLAALRHMLLLALENANNEEHQWLLEQALLDFDNEFPTIG